MEMWLYTTAFVLSTLSVRDASTTEPCPFINSTGTINLTSVGLTQITADTFITVYNCSPHLESAQTLDLSRNQISSIDSNSFWAFANIATLNLSHNAISDIKTGTLTSISDVLEYVYLGYNNFTRLSAGPYSLFKLIEIHFEHNNISYVEPGVVDETNLNLLYFNLQHNKLTRLEPWPYMIGYTNGDRDIYFDLQNNQITGLSNSFGWVYNLQHPYEVKVELQYNLIESLTFDELASFKPDIERENAFSFVATLYLNITNNPYFCDCNLFYLASDLRSTVLRWNKIEQFRYICASPFPGYDWLHDLALYNFICYRTIDCPANCSCQDRPHNDTFYVDCRGAGLTEFPERIPDTNRSKIEMLMDNNAITSLKNTTYISRVYNLSIGDNRLTSLGEDVLKLMPNLTFLNVRNNQIRTLPSYIQRFNADVVKLNGNPLYCECDSLWLTDWIGISRSSDSLTLTCDSDTGTHVIRNLREHDLNCINTDFIIMGSIIGVALFLLLLIGLFVFRCPYESKVLLQKIFRIHPFDKYKVDEDNSKEADIYLVFDDDPDVIGWVKSLLHKLRKKKPFYKIINPYRFTEGGPQEEQIRKWIGKSKRVIVVLSKNIFKNHWRKFEIEVAEDNLITELAKNSENRNAGNAVIDLTVQPENFDDIREAGRIIYVKFNKEIEEHLKEDPWPKRLLDKPVLNVGDRIFMSKMRYELPSEGNGSEEGENFRIAPKREDIARIKQDKQRQARASMYVKDENKNGADAIGLPRVIQVATPKDPGQRRPISTSTLFVHNRANQTFDLEDIESRTDNESRTENDTSSQGRHEDNRSSSSAGSVRKIVVQHK